MLISEVLLGKCGILSESNQQTNMLQLPQRQTREKHYR